MSLYPSQNSIGQPSYSQYPQPLAVNGYYHHYPHQHQHQPPIPPPAVYSLNPVSFRRDYTNRLNELTFNSRPIIQGLSMLAQEYSRYADIVAQCLEAHIRRVPPWMKLPAFYLLDAISKNVYEPYARHFAGFVLPLFLETYNAVDENIRSKMEEMLLTWRTGSPHGKELFGVPPQIAIERGIWGDAALGQNGPSAFHAGSSQITRSQVLCELDFTLNQKKQAAYNNPYDSACQNHINVLTQLRKLVEAGVSQDELQQILNQLRNLAKSPAPPVPPPAPASIQQWPSYSAVLPQPPSALKSVPPPAVLVSAYPPDLNTHQMPPLTTGSTPVLQSVAISQAPANITNLLSTLLKAGVVSANSTPTGAGATAKEEASKQEQIEAIDLEREASRAYRQVVLSQQIRLSTTDIVRAPPQIVELLYDQLTAQCKQCGVRFADTIVGKKQMEGHLDMHFRQNRKANQSVGRGHSRSWFVGLEDWVHDSSSDGKGKDRADGSRSLSSAAKAEAALRTLFVVVPPGEEAKTIACPICKEIFEPEFLEEDEEWVWKNAVKKDDRIYHATCHAEALVSTNSLAARLRTTAGGSRAGTPEASSVVRSTPSPPALRVSKSPTASPQSKIAGTKRKVLDNDLILNGEPGSTPPLKKLALAS